jgi:hypothetical protein
MRIVESVATRCFSFLPGNIFLRAARRLKGLIAIGAKRSSALAPFFILLVIATARAQQPAGPKSVNTNAGPNFPSCKDPISSVEVPNAPHGLFAILFPGAEVNSKATKYLLHNPVVCGANVYIVWNRVDRGPRADPRYDWTSIDEQIAPWVAAGKVVNLIVWATGYGPRANATPGYVFSEVPSVTCPSFGHVPVFWNPAFISSYQSFMSAVVHKYGSNASVDYIRFGLGAGGEIFPACMYSMREQGFSKETWRQYLFNMLDYEKSVHSPKQLTVGLNAFGNPPDLLFTASVAERAVQDGIAIGNQGLTIEDAKNDAAGQPCMADWCRLFRQFRGKVPFVLQTGGVSHPDGSGSSCSDFRDLHRRLACSLRPHRSELRPLPRGLSKSV